MTSLEGLAEAARTVRETARLWVKSFAASGVIHSSDLEFDLNPGHGTLELRIRRRAIQTKTQFLKGGTI